MSTFMVLCICHHLWSFVYVTIYSPLYMSPFMVLCICNHLWSFVYVTIYSPLYVTIYGPLYMSLFIVLCMSSFMVLCIWHKFMVTVTAKVDNCLLSLWKFKERRHLYLSPSSLKILFSMYMCMYKHFDTTFHLFLNLLSKFLGQIKLQINMGQDHNLLTHS